jgi:hypothetical protein
MSFEDYIRLIVCDRPIKAAGRKDWYFLEKLIVRVQITGVLIEEEDDTLKKRANEV